jgi:hypothetical protein
MFRKKVLVPIVNECGVGLITAVFVIVVIGMFGSLIARYAAISSVSSAEDYLWAQALYSAQSAAQVAILYDDGGGTGSESLTSVAGFTTSVTNIVSGVRASAQRQINGNAVHRQVEVRVSL